jgi:hypothetical protein
MHPQVQQLIAMLRAAVPPDAPRLWQLPAAQGRMFADAFMLLRNEGGPEMAERRDLEIPGRRGVIPARLRDARHVRGRDRDDLRLRAEAARGLVLYSLGRRSFSPLPRNPV